jgi:hypothetical protein
MKRPSGLVMLFMALFWSEPGRAAEATLSTLVCEPLAKKAALQLTPADDSDLYLSVKDGIRKAVEQAGHPVEEKAGLQLYYSLNETAVEIRERGPTLGRLEVRTVNREVRSQLLVNIWSNKQDSLIGGRRTESGLRVSNVLIATFELNRQDNGRCVWRGEGAVELGAVAAQDVAPGLADAVASRIGQGIDRARQPLR